MSETCPSPDVETHCVGATSLPGGAMPGGPGPNGDLVAGFYRTFGVAPHPVLERPAAELVRRCLATAAGRAELVEMVNARATRIRMALSDPLYWGFEMETWEDADTLLQECGILGIFGGNRATKTVYAAKRGVQTAKYFPGALVAILAETETSSITTVQKIVWAFLKAHFGHLNGKRDAIFKINYSQSGGFTDRKLVLPNGSEMYFLTYNQNPGDYEGWEFGAPIPMYEKVCQELREAGGTWVPPNVGAVADESMSLAWLKMLSRRLKFRKAKLLWPFTPVKGITPAIKELVGSSAVTLESRPSELLPRENFPDCGKGEMPYIKRCAFPNAMAIYFFTLYNKFGPAPGRTYYDEVKELCAGKSSEYVERVAYGMARDGVARAFPTFGPWNMVRREQLPAVGTNYFFCDPAGARNWFALWVRVSPMGGGQVAHYIYRDWPDGQRYGEWAVATEREVNEENRKGWDGDAGPAQVGLGYGVTKYKQVFLEAERVLTPAVLSGNWEKGMDPQQVRLVRRALARGEDLGQVREVIAERYVDPRAGASEHLAEQGGTCIIDEFEAVQVDGEGKVTGPGMTLLPASGVNEEEGLTAVNELLDWNRGQPLMPVMNQPHLFVCEECQQVRWMFENYTGRSGAKGACKDPADLVRYMALAKLEHVEEHGNRGRAGRGW